MGELTCTICIIDYNTDNKVPKVLPCGHTICVTCLQDLIQSNLKCPICRKDLTGVNASDYPNNFTLLSIIENGVSNDTMDLSLIIPPLVSRANDALEGLVSELNEKQALVERIRKGVQLLDGRSSGKAPKVARSVLLKTVKDMERELYHINRIEDLPIINLHLKDFQSQDKYLQQIDKRLQRNEELYVEKEINGITKYGKLSLQDGKILVHCLYETQIPATQCVLLKFDDLKVVMCGFSEAFLVFMCNQEKLLTTAMIDIEGTRDGRAFANLCTGEIGKSYKRCSYFKSVLKNDRDIITVPISEGSSEDSTYQLFFETKDNIKKYKNFERDCEMVIKCLDNGDLEICRYNDTKFIEISNLAGILRKPKDLYKILDCKIGNHKKIVDCGVVLSTQ